MFSPLVIEKLGYYVYLYINPFDGKVFYVGKGKGNRVFQHLKDESEHEKAQQIKKIRAQRKDPIIEILVHGLEDEETALRIEAGAIDLLGVKALTNKVRGWGSNLVGRMEVRELSALYDKTPGVIDEPVLLIRVNQKYRYGMSQQELYEITRGVWTVGTRREKAQLAFAIYRGIVKEVYVINSWHSANTTPYHTRSDVAVEGRWEFLGESAPDAIREKYIDKSVESYFPAKAQNPITYVNC